MSAFFRTLVAATIMLACVVIVVGGYVRLSDAGLGCPDWPLCYGRTVPGEIGDPGAAAKAWKEMGHRYLAGALGILILLLAALSWKKRRSRPTTAAILGLVIFQ